MGTDFFFFLKQRCNFCPLLSFLLTQGVQSDFDDLILTSPGRGLFCGQNCTAFIAASLLSYICHKQLRLKTYPSISRHPQRLKFSLGTEDNCNAVTPSSPPPELFNNKDSALPLINWFKK